MRHYTFECVDEENNTRTVVEFSTENDVWSGYDGPMWKFFDFLKGTGYVFDIEDQIGVMSETFGGFRSASEEL